MSNPWHRSEPRAVRPFFTAKLAEAALEDSMIRLSPGAPGSPDEGYDLDELDLRQLEPSILPRMAAVTDWLPTGYSADDFELVVIAQNKFLKHSRVLLRVKCSEAIPDEVSIPDEWFSRLGGGRNLRLTVAICLSDDRQPSPGVPFQAGHWIASKTFTLREKLLKSLFDVRQRTDEEWIEAGYPAKTVYSVEYMGGIGVPAEDGLSIANVFVHLDAHNRMTGDGGGTALQSLLSVEMIAQVLEQSRKEWKDLESIPPGTTIHNLAKRLLSDKKADVGALNLLVANGAKLRAVLQEQLSTLSTITSGMKP